jgi:DNA-binding IclR family transcriptional regulator
MPRTPPAKYDAPAVRLAVRLVEFLADAGRPAGVTEAARALGTNKNMAYRLLATLAREDWVRAAPDGAGYALTLRPFQAAGKVVNRLDLVAAAEGPMRELRDALDEYVYLGVLRGDRVLFVRDLRPRAKPVQVAGGVGYDFPLHDNAPGKALLAWGGEPLLSRVVRRGLRRTTPRTIVDPAALRRHLADVRRRGYATDLEENIPGVICLAVPVFDRDGAVAGTVGITTLTAFHTVKALTGTLGPAVVDTGRRISSALGHVAQPQRGRTANIGTADKRR